jgi:hypothetical protein
MEKPRWRAAFSILSWKCNGILGRFPCHQFPEVQVFFDLPALVTMLPRFLGLIVHFAEGMFGVLNGFTDDFQRFGHSLVSFVQVSPGVKDVNGLPLERPTVLDN